MEYQPAIPVKQVLSSEKLADFMGQVQKIDGRVQIGTNNYIIIMVRVN